MTNSLVLVILILKTPNPRHFLFLNIIGLLLGLGMLSFAAYYTFKDPQKVKRRAGQYRINDTDWAQSAAVGMFFTSLSIAGILSSVGDPEREVQGIEAGVRLALIIIALLSFVVFVIARFFAKLSEK